MRAPRIKGKFWGQNLSLKKAEEPQNAGCSICRRKCVDEKRRLLKECDRLTRSATRWLKDMNNNTVIIYETYRCMPLLGDENVHAPDWEEHIVRYARRRSQYSRWGVIIGNLDQELEYMEFN